MVLSISSEFNMNRNTDIIESIPKYHYTGDLALKYLLYAIRDAN